VRQHDSLDVIGKNRSVPMNWKMKVNLLLWKVLSE